ncbi:MAG: tRNA (cytidine(34)-2'-O)-methyltransferase [Holosporales bacterium]
MHLALYQPEIPQNVGTLARMSACFNLSLHLIGPLGFLLSNRHLLRAGMDYLRETPPCVHLSWKAFQPILHTQREKGGRLISLTSRASSAYTDFVFHPEDVLCGGSESIGLPDFLIQEAEASLSIPMPGGGRSLNLAIACALVTGEALRQTQGFFRPSH